MVTQQRIYLGEIFLVFTRPPNGNTQSTINEIVPYVGIALQSGRRVSVQMHPATPNSGIFFVRTAVPATHCVIRASWINVVDTQLRHR
jgi:UDP-3-O-acyl-N-acetylglucosamine deacetylase